jgi:hypothetical protein
MTDFATKNPDDATVAGIILGSRHRAARRIVDPNTGDVWVWAAEEATHAEGAERLGIPTAGSAFSIPSPSAGA